MLHFFYLLFIAPLEFLMRLVLEWGFSSTHSWGWSLVLLSLAVNTAILPISKWAERRQEEERALRRSMARHAAMLRECFKGQERFALTSTLRRLNGYDWLLAVRGSVGLLLQIPFFIAAYHLLSGFTPLRGHSFGPFADLGAPDGLLAFGGAQVNLLPFAMTAANLLAAFVYARRLALRDKVQIYGIALLFLALLYPAASALVLYWTLNNVYSLGKNTVARALMRRPEWRTLWAVCRSGAKEDVGHFRARLLEAFRCSFGAGALVWTYACALACARHNFALDAGFKSASLHFAGQCVLTAFWAGVTLAFLVPRHPHRRRGRRRLFLMASVGVLYFCQLTWFNEGFAISRGRFPFDLWGGDGRLIFALWALGNLVIGTFRHRLAGMFAGVCKRFPPRLNGSDESGARRRAASPPVPASRDTFILACLTGGLCGFFLCCFVPFCTYFHNPNEFDFNAWELLGKVTPCCLLTIFVASLLFFVAASLLPSECVRLPWKRGGATGGKVTVIHTVLTALLLAALVEGTLLSYELPQLAGEEELFDSKYRLLIDAVIWFDFLLIGTWYWRRTAKHVPALLAVLLVFSCTSLLDFYRTGDEKIDVRQFKGVNGLRILDRESFFPKLRFSNTANTIILLVDSLDTLSFEKTLETYPELKNILDGFWVFRENLGAGGLTFYALPQILSGKIISEEQLGNDFVQNALVGEQSMAADALRYGRRAFIDANFWQVVSGQKRMTAEHLRISNESLRRHLGQFFFRFYPYWGKRLALGMVNFKNREADAAMTSGEDINKRTFNKVIGRMPERCSENVLQFIYFFGVHEPFIKRDIITTTREFMSDFGVFLGALKKYGLYDKSTLIVMADHGLYSRDYRDWYPERHGAQPTALFPLLMVKTPKSSGEMVFREDLTSSAHVRLLVRDFYEKGASNAVMSEWLAGLPAVRYIYQENQGKFEARGTFSTMTLKHVGPEMEER